MWVSAICALDEDNCIGRDGTLPWRIRQDLRLFKEHTWGKPLLLGRKTFESIGKPLPGRESIVVSRTLKELEGAHLVRSVDEGIELARSFGADELMVGGGAGIYKEALELVDRLYLTRVHLKVKDGDTFFPMFDRAAFVQKNTRAFEEDGVQCTFETLVRP